MDEFEKHFVVKKKKKQDIKEHLFDSIYMNV